MAVVLLLVCFLVYNVYTIIDRCNKYFSKRTACLFSKYAYFRNRADEMNQRRCRAAADRPSCVPVPWSGVSCVCHFVSFFLKIGTHTEHNTDDGGKRYGVPVEGVSAFSGAPE